MTGSGYWETCLSLHTSIYLYIQVCVLRRVSHRVASFEKFVPSDKAVLKKKAQTLAHLLIAAAMLSSERGAWTRYFR